MRHALWLSALMPLAGCWLVVPCGSGAECPSPDPIEDSLWEVTGHDREDLVTGVLEVRGDEVIVEYVDEDGQTWEVAYAVVERYPEE